MAHSQPRSKLTQPSRIWAWPSTQVPTPISFWDNPPFNYSQPHLWALHYLPHLASQAGSHTLFLQSMSDFLKSVCRAIWSNIIEFISHCSALWSGPLLKHLSIRSFCKTFMEELNLSHQHAFHNCLSQHTYLINVSRLNKEMNKARDINYKNHHRVAKLHTNQKEPWDDTQTSTLWRSLVRGQSKGLRQREWNGWQERERAPLCTIHVQFSQAFRSIWNAVLVITGSKRAVGEKIKLWLYSFV